MKSMVLALAALAAVGLGCGAAMAQGSESPGKGDVEHGRKIWVTYGCYQCHGYQGQGGAGPKLAPNPLPYAAFAQQLRHPRARMPIYTETTVSKSDLDDLYAYAQSIPKGKTVAEIPLLSGVKQ